MQDSQSLNPVANALVNIHLCGATLTQHHILLKYF